MNEAFFYNLSKTSINLVTLSSNHKCGEPKH